MDTSAFRGEKEVNVRVIPNWIWTEWNHKKQLENEVTKRNR